MSNYSQMYSSFINVDLRIMSTESLKIVKLFNADQLARDHIESTGTDDSFFISNVSDIFQKFQLWKELMPRVDIAYAMKANSHVSVVGSLAALGE